jgi:hypothetical protein
MTELNNSEIFWGEKENLKNFYEALKNKYEVFTNFWI